MIKVEVVSETGGLVGLFKNVNKTLAPKLERLEAEGWTVVSVVNENTPPFKTFTRIVIAICTLGIYAKAPGYIVVLRK